MQTYILLMTVFHTISPTSEMKGYFLIPIQIMQQTVYPFSFFFQINVDLSILIPQAKVRMESTISDQVVDKIIKELFYSLR